MRVVGENAADLGGTDKDRLRPRLVHPLLDLPLPREVDRFALDRQHLTVLTGKPAQQRAANHAAMARDPAFLPLREYGLASALMSPFPLRPLSQTNRSRHSPFPKPRLPRLFLTRIPHA